MLLAAIQQSTWATTADRSKSLGAPNDPDVPQRRRISTAQRQVLRKSFKCNSHPSKQERVALANEVGLELKAVTVWFQNKRQTTKRHALAWSHSPIPSRVSAKSVRTSSSTFKAVVSLDHIAELSERPSGATVPLHRPPLTPRRTNTRRYSLQSDDSLDLLMHMPSSPIAPPSSPSADIARLSVLPSRSKTMRSLEWACANARAGSAYDEDQFQDFPLRAPDYEELDNDTDTEVDEAITPNSSTNSSVALPLFPPKLDVWNKFGEHGYMGARVAVHESEDVEAAMVLLGFMGRK